MNPSKAIKVPIYPLKAQKSLLKIVGSWKKKIKYVINGMLINPLQIEAVGTYCNTGIIIEETLCDNDLILSIILVILNSPLTTHFIFKNLNS